MLTSHSHRVFYFFFDAGRNHPLSRNCLEIMLHFSGSPDLILLYVLFHQLWSYAALFRVTWSHPAVCSVSPTLELCCTFQGHLISSCCMFCFTNSAHLPILDAFIFHLLTSRLLVDMPPSIQHHYSGTIYPILSNTSSLTSLQDPLFLLWTLNALPVCMWVCGFVCVCVCVCVHACVESDEKDFKWSVVVCLFM